MPQGSGLRQTTYESQQNRKYELPTTFDISPRLRRSLVFAAIVIVTRVAYFGLEYFMCRNFGSYQFVAPQVQPDGFLGALARWDSQWYGTIAKDGYINRHQCAFFPALPIAGKILVAASCNKINYVFALNLVSISALFLSVHLIAQETRCLIYDELAPHRKWCAWAMVFSPASYFFLSGYAESLTLLFTIATFSESINSKYVKAAAAGLAAVTSPLGLATLLTFIACRFRLLQLENGSFTSLVREVCFSVVPFSIWLSFLYVQFKNPFVWATAQHGWARELTFPLLPLLQFQQQSAGPGWEIMRNMANLGALIMILMLLIKFVVPVSLSKRSTYGIIFAILATFSTVRNNGMMYAEAVYRHSFCNLWFQESLWVGLLGLRKPLMALTLCLMTVTDCMLILGYPLT